MEEKSRGRSHSSAPSRLGRLYIIMRDFAGGRSERAKSCFHSHADVDYISAKVNLKMAMRTLGGSSSLLLLLLLRLRGETRLRELTGQAQLSHGKEHTMADTNQEKVLQQIEEKVRALSNAALATGHPLLLSALGKDLGEDLKVIKTHTRGGLSRFIQERMSKDFSIVLGGEYRNVQAIVRAGSADLMQAEDPGILKQFESRSPRYHYKFWAAFSVPLEAGKKRFIDTSSLNFEDVEIQDERLGCREIPSRLIASENSMDRDAIISKNIEEWLQENGEDRSKFLKATRSRPEKIDRSFERATLLDLLIQSLDAKQLASTSMSLDTVSTLLKKRV